MPSGVAAGADASLVTAADRPELGAGAAVVRIRRSPRKRDAMHDPEASAAVRLLAAINWLVLALLLASAGWTAWIVLQNWGGISV